MLRHSRAPEGDPELDFASRAPGLAAPPQRSCLSIKLSQRRVTEGGRSTASVPLTAIQKGKHHSIPLDPKRPCPGAPARAAAACCLPSQCESALSRRYSCSWPHARNAFPRSQLLCGCSGSSSLCPWHLVCCSASGEHPVQLWWQMPSTVLPSLNPDGTHHPDRGSMLCCLLPLSLCDRLNGTWLGGW